MRMLGYARAVGRTESVEAQVAALEEAGVERVFIDRLHAGAQGYPALSDCISCLEPDDVFTVTAIASLPRGVPALVGVVRRVRERGAAFRELSGRYDTTGPEGRAFFRWIEELELRLDRRIPS